MKDLLKDFQGVMNFTKFRWIFDPLQTFQKSAIFIALMVRWKFKNRHGSANCIHLRCKSPQQKREMLEFSFWNCTGFGHFSFVTVPTYRTYSFLHLTSKNMLSLLIVRTPSLKAAFKETNKQKNGHVVTRFFFARSKPHTWIPTDPWSLSGIPKDIYLF